MTDENIITVLNTKAQEDLVEKTKAELTETDPTDAEKIIEENIKAEK